MTSALDVRIAGVHRVFPPTRRDAAPHTVLRDVDLDIAAGSIVAVLGRSGSGKSTLLRLVAGLDAADGGVVEIGGTAVRPRDQRCAVAFQEARLLPWRSVARNVALGLPRDQRSDAARVAELLHLVGLDEAADRRPREISGGMAQRASLARALARRPGVLVLDEPFGALDALTRLQMHDLLLDVHRAEPSTIVLVTHDVDEALALADRIVLLGAGTDGATGVTELLDVTADRPRDHGDPALVALRARLLDGLGVADHRRGR